MSSSNSQNGHKNDVIQVQAWLRFHSEFRALHHIVIPSLNQSNLNQIKLTRPNQSLRVSKCNLLAEPKTLSFHTAVTECTCSVEVMLPIHQTMLLHPEMAARPADTLCLDVVTLRGPSHQGSSAERPTFSFLQAVAGNQCWSCPDPIPKSPPGGTKLPFSITFALKGHLSGKASVTCGQGDLCSPQGGQHRPRQTQAAVQ